MWNRSVAFYGYQPLIRTLPRREPMERKSAGDANGGGGVTELLRSPSANTPFQTGSSHSAPLVGVASSEDFNRRAERVRPNRHANGGDGARGHRVDPPHPMTGVSPPLVFADSEDANWQELVPTLNENHRQSDAGWPELVPTLNEASPFHNLVPPKHIRRDGRYRLAGTRSDPK